jgi:hypothetical protein
VALANPAKLIGKYGVYEGMPLPFGFKDVYFYDQIQCATGIMHVFTYTFSENVVDYFANLLLDACK